MMGLLLWIFAAFPIVLYWYIQHNDLALSWLPPEAAAISPDRYSDADAVRHLARHAKSTSIVNQLPPKTNRRYIVVGGSGFLGGWIVIHLLQRGEDPQRIRVVDIRPPTRSALTTGIARGMQFVQTDITDAKAVADAFAAPWSSGSSAEITVFHTAASIRFYERHPSLLPLSAKVNVEGTKNIVAAARSIGASALVYTSSGSVAIHRSRFWLWPWEKEPARFVQVINDHDDRLPKRHDEFFSNYAATKASAERMVCDADGATAGEGKLRTGALRPGNSVFGPGGDMSCGAYLVRKTNLAWNSHVMQSYSYVENVSLAHLCYERRLIEISQGHAKVDIGGQAFTITDPGTPLTYGDIECILTTLTDNETTFTRLSPTLMLLISHFIEMYTLGRIFLLSYVPFLGRMMGAINGDLMNLQPSIFALLMVHLIFDDSRARLPPEQGGLGYNPLWTTFDGLCKTVEEHKKPGLNNEDRERAAKAGVSFGFRFGLARKTAQKFDQKIEEIGVQAMN